MAWSDRWRIRASADWPFLKDKLTGETTELGAVLQDDAALVAAMEKVREVVSGTLSMRKAKQIRVRQPLAKPDRGG